MTDHSPENGINFADSITLFAMFAATLLQLTSLPLNMKDAAVDIYYFFKWKFDPEFRPDYRHTYRFFMTLIELHTCRSTCFDLGVTLTILANPLSLTPTSLNIAKEAALGADGLSRITTRLGAFCSCVDFIAPMMNINAETLRDFGWGLSLMTYFYNNHQSHLIVDSDNYKVVWNVLAILCLLTFTERIEELSERDRIRGRLKLKIPRIVEIGDEVTDEHGEVHLWEISPRA